MKRFYKIFASWFLCLFLVLSQFIVSFADVNSLMIGSGSNALMTLDLTDNDYLMMSPRSSIVSISNTIDYNDVYQWICLVENESGRTVYRDAKIGSDGSYLYRVPSGYTLIGYGVSMHRNALPNAGIYRMQADFSSVFSIDPTSFILQSARLNKNAATSQSNINVSNYTTVSSGDWYLDVVVDVGSIDVLTLICWVPDVIENEYIDGLFKASFTYSTAQANVTTVGKGMGSSDYEDDVSSSLSDLSSSVDSMTEDLSSAAENLEYISTSQNLIIQGIDNVIMHISDQLYAFWDQLFNLIHLPTLAKMDDIISAINNMDLEIEVNLDGLKTTINNMSTAVQNKLQSTTDQITGGYDNTGITQENEKLEQSINQYDEVESGIFEDAEGFIGDFEYPSVDSLPLGIIKALAFVGSFLQGVFLSMGEFSVIITFSLTMIFVMVVVGYHRIRS